MENLYHYTDFNAMRGIITKGEIWLWNLRRMNDSQEMQYFIKELKIALKKLLAPEDCCRMEELFDINLKDFDKLSKIGEKYGFDFNSKLGELASSKIPEDKTFYVSYSTLLSQYPDIQKFAADLRKAGTDDKKIAKLKEKFKKNFKKTLPLNGTVDVDKIINAVKDNDTTKTFEYKAKKENDLYKLTKDQVKNLKFEKLYVAGERFWRISDKQNSVLGTVKVDDTCKTKRALKKTLGNDFMRNLLLDSNFTGFNFVFDSDKDKINDNEANKLYNSYVENGRPRLDKVKDKFEQLRGNEANKLWQLFGKTENSFDLKTSRAIKSIQKQLSKYNGENGKTISILSNDNTKIYANIRNELNKIDFAKYEANSELIRFLKATKEDFDRSTEMYKLCTGISRDVVLNNNANFDDNKAKFEELFNAHKTYNEDKLGIAPEAAAENENDDRVAKLEERIAQLEQQVNERNVQEEQPEQEQEQQNEQQVNVVMMQMLQAIAEQVADMQNKMNANNPAQIANNPAQIEEDTSVKEENSVSEGTQSENAEKSAKEEELEKENKDLKQQLQAVTAEKDEAQLLNAKVCTQHQQYAVLIKKAIEMHENDEIEKAQLKQLINQQQHKDDQQLINQQQLAEDVNRADRKTPVAQQVQQPVKEQPVKEQLVKAN